MKKTFTEKVYQITSQIPKGKVTTYGRIAAKIDNPKAARAVGNVLHNHQIPNLPCHRVVNKNGKVAENFGDGGWQSQKRKLLKEGITFKNKKQVDLEKHFFDF